MYCTTLYLHKRILYRCLFFILTIGLLLQSLAQATLFAPGVAGRVVRRLSGVDQPLAPACRLPVQTGQTGKYVREGGLEKLDGEYDGWVVTPEIRQAIMDIWPPNFWLSAAQVRERLLAAGHISSLEEISESSIHRVAQETGFAEARRLLREMFEFTADGPEWRDDACLCRQVLIERVSELNERLMALLQEGEELTPQLTLEVESLKQGLGVPSTLLEKVLPYAYHLQ